MNYAPPIAESGFRRNAVITWPKGEMGCQAPVAITLPILTEPFTLAELTSRAAVTLIRRSARRALAGGRSTALERRLLFGR